MKFKKGDVLVYKEEDGFQNYAVMVFLKYDRPHPDDFVDCIVKDFKEKDNCTYWVMSEHFWFLNGRHVLTEALDV